MMKNSILILLGVSVAVCCVAAAGLLGGYETVDVGREDVVRAANEAARLFSERFYGKYAHRLHTIKTAEAQVVAGTNYKMTVVVGKTNCLKKQSFDEIQNCDFQDGFGVYNECIVVVNRDLKDRHSLMSFACIQVN